MNIEEIVEYFKDDIDYLEEELKYPNFKGRYITIRDKEYKYLKKLLDYITNLQEENKKLKELQEKNDKFYDETMKDIKDGLIDRIKSQDKEIERLNNIIYQLRYWIVNNKHNENTKEHYLVVDYGKLLNKLKELKGSAKE